MNITSLMHNNDENNKSKLNEIEAKINSINRNDSQFSNTVREFNGNANELNTSINNEILNNTNHLTQLISSSKFNSRRKAANLLKILNEHQQKQQNNNHTTATNGNGVYKVDQKQLIPKSYSQQQHKQSPNKSLQKSVSSQQIVQQQSMAPTPQRVHKHKYNVWDEQLYADVIQINCNSMVAELHKKKFGSGGKGKCIHIDNKWMTPIEFEQYCGKGNCRDWKRTLKAGGQPLISLLDDNILMCHAVSCACAACSDDASVVGPIRPFTRYRRRKRDEILAQNAFKKFLSLKPPTLITDQLTRIDNHSQAHQQQQQPLSNSCCDSNNSSMFMKNEDTCSNNGYSMSPTNSQNDFNDNSEFDEPSSSSYKDIENAEHKNWTLLEQAADILITQAQNLKDLIEQAKNQSKLTKQTLLEELKQSQNYNYNKNNNNSTNNNNSEQHYEDDEDDDDDLDNDDDDCDIDINNSRPAKMMKHFHTNGDFEHNNAYECDNQELN